MGEARGLKAGRHVASPPGAGVGPLRLGRVRTLRLPPGAGLPRPRAGAQQAAALIRKHWVLPAEALVAALLVQQAWSGEPSLSSTPGFRPAASVALIFAIVLPLLWRRKAPLAVFAVIFAAAFAQAFTNPIQVTDDLAVLVAFYAVAATEPHRRVLAAVGALAGGAVLLTFLSLKPGQGWTTIAGAWLGLSVLVGVAGSLGYYTRGRRAYLERERERDVELAAAAERARIAREMHDIVAHNIAVMIALADGAAYTIPQDPDQAATMMGLVSQTGRSALTEMRRMLGILRRPEDSASGNAPQPALADLGAMISTVREAGLPVRLSVSGQPFPLPASAQLTLYRVVQEALTNTMKHADATSAHVRLGYQDEEVEVEVTDDGRLGGTAVPVPPGGGSVAGGPGLGGGQGLAGMRERAAVFGGEVSAGPRPEGGWRVHTLLRVSAARADGQAAGSTQT
jgi:signal transduction histidine kinase